MRLARTLLAMSILAFIATSTGYGAAATGTTQPASVRTALRWDAAWSAAPQRPSASYTPNWSEQGFTNQTVRQTVRVTVSGTAVRIRLAANTYGATPLTVAGATVARTASGAAIQPGSTRRITFDRASTFTIPAGAELASDPCRCPSPRWTP